MTAEIFYWMQTAYMGFGETRHPEIVMKELAKKHDFKILEATPYTILNGWKYVIEFENAPILPGYIEMKAVNQ